MDHSIDGSYIEPHLRPDPYDHNPPSIGGVVSIIGLLLIIIIPVIIC